MDEATLKSLRDEADRMYNYYATQVQTPYTISKKVQWKNTRMWLEKKLRG